MTEETQDFHIQTSNEPVTEIPPQTPITPGQETPRSSISPKMSNNLLRGMLAGLVIVIIGGGVAWSYTIVRKNLTDDFSLKFARAVHLPAGFVNKKNIAYADYVDDSTAVQFFYNVNKSKDPNLTVPSTDEVRKNVWDRLVRTALLEDLATKSNIKITSQDTEAEFKKLSAALGSEDAANKMIKESYNWSPDVFKQHIIFPYLLQQKILSTTSTADIINSKARASAEDILTKVKEDKVSFADLAKQYSQDGSAEAGGDLGWFDQQTMVKQFSDMAFSLKPNEISGLVQTQFGFHIIKVLEREEKKGKPARVHAAHILIRADVDQFLSDLVKQSVIKQWIRIP